MAWGTQLMMCSFCECGRGKEKLLLSLVSTSTLPRATLDWACLGFLERRWLPPVEMRFTDEHMA